MPGDSHEDVGPALLEEHGVSVELARFARTHGRWDSGLSLEDLLVALADNVAVGKRNEGLEQVTVDRLVELTGLKAWEAFSVLDEILQSLSVQTTRIWARLNDLLQLDFLLGTSSGIGFSMLIKQSAPDCPFTFTTLMFSGALGWLIEVFFSRRG